MTAKKNFGTFLRNRPEIENQAKSFIVGSAPSDLFRNLVLPKHFDGRKIWKDYLSPIKNQGNCGACYSCASVGILADRFSILTLGKIKPSLSISDMVICATMSTDDNASLSISRTTFNPSTEKSVMQKYREEEIETRKKYACLGNSLYNAARYLYVQGSVTDVCIPDELVTEIGLNEQVPFCEDIEGVETDLCENQNEAQRLYRAGKVYQLPYDEKDLETTEREIMIDIYKWGPIACGFLIYDDFLKNYDGNSVYSTKAFGEASLGHAVRIVGWGEEPQAERVVKYWICANSWGTDWGDGGYFKIERFLPGLDLEKNSLSLIPDLPGIVEFGQQYTGQSFITQQDETDRRLLGVSLYTLYPSSVIEKIKKGLLAGDLNKLIVKPRELPLDYSSFLAGKIGLFSISELRNEPSRLDHIWTHVLIFVIGVIAGVVFWNRYKYRLNH